MKCKNCGADLNESETLCPVCSTMTAPDEERPAAKDGVHTEETVSAPASPADRADHTDEYEKDDIEHGRLLSVLSYLWIFVLIPVFAAGDSDYVKFHRRQGLILFAAESSHFAVQFLLMGILRDVAGSVPALAAGIVLYAGLAFFAVLSVTGVINAVKGKARELPYIGRLAEKTKQR